MASLYRKRGTSNWYCSYLSRDGKSRVNRSTGKPKKSAAMGEALGWEKEEAEIRAQESEANASILRLVSDAGELARARRLTVDRARTMISTMLELSTGQGLSSYTIGTWIDEWLSGKEGTVAESTFVAYRAAVKEFRRSLGERADLPLEHLSETDVRRFRDHERKRGKTAKTCNLRVKIVSGALKRAAGQGLIMRNPAATLEPLDEIDSTTRLPFAMEDIKRLLAAADGEWRGMILFGLYCGMRLGDAANLKWSNIDLAAKTASFAPKKTKRVRRRTGGKGPGLTIPLHPALEDYLLRLPSSDDSEDSLFPKLAGRGSGGHQGLSVEFVELMQEAGLEDKPTKGTGKKTGAKGDGETARRGVRERSFHSLRHPAASLMANAGVAMELRKKISGHTTDTAHEGYTHLELETLRTAIEALPSIKKKHDG